MDPFDLMCLRHSLPPIRCSETKTSELDFNEELIDKILGCPEKIEIPERYIPEPESPLPPEETKIREQKAARICRLLSKSNGGNLPLVLPPGLHSITLRKVEGGAGGGVPFLGGPPGGGLSKVLNSCSSVPSSPVRRILSVKKNSSSSSSLKRRPNSNSGAGSYCDWSLAGVTVPPQSCWSRDSSGSSSSISASERLFGGSVPPAFGIGENSPIPYEPGVVFGGGSKVVNFQGHPSRSSSQSSSSGRSSNASAASTSASTSTDREDLLHLQQYLAREVTSKSRIVAIRALASSPSPPPTSSYRQPSPPSPVQLPTVQQREGFFT